MSDVEESVVVGDEGDDINLSPSIRDALVARREHIAANRFIDLDIPGYDSRLFCRYGLVDAKRLNAIGERITKTIRERDERALAAALDTLIAACDEFFVRHNGREIPLREVIEQDEPVRYSTELAEFLKFDTELPETPTARSVCKALFMDNEIAIAAHNHQLSRWMMGNETDVFQEMLETDPL